MTFTKKSIKNYRSNKGLCCPSCSSQMCTTSKVEYTCDEPIICIPHHCKNCDSNWIEQYRLEKVYNLEQSFEMNVENIKWMRRILVLFGLKN